MPDLLVSRRLHASTSALRAMSARYSDFSSTKTAKIMDGKYKIPLSSTKTAKIMDGHIKIPLPSTKSALFHGREAFQCLALLEY